MEQGKHEKGRNVDKGQRGADPDQAALTPEYDAELRGRFERAAKAARQAGHPYAGLFQEPKMPKAERDELTQGYWLGRVKVMELMPGMEFDNQPVCRCRTKESCLQTIVFIIQGPHPLFPGFQMVVWQICDGSYTFDALSPVQEISGLLWNATGVITQDMLKSALQRALHFRPAAKTSRAGKGAEAAQTEAERKADGKGEAERKADQRGAATGKGEAAGSAWGAQSQLPEEL